MIARLGRSGPLVLLALSLSLAHASMGLAADDAPRSGATTETARPPESEREPDETVESAVESTPGTGSLVVASESSDGDDAEPSNEPEPPQSRPAAEVFVPTEEISEDFAVPFPVDI